MRTGFLVLLTLGMVAAACSDDTAPTTIAEKPPDGGPSLTTATVPTGPKPVIVDYSPTVSDVGGFLFLLAHPGVDVIAVSLPATGEAGCELGLHVTLGVLTMMERDDVPVACGPDSPSDAESWPQAFLAAQSNLKFGLPKPQAEGQDRTGSALIVDAVQSSDRPVTIWAVAPMTNVAQALLSDPSIASNMEEIVIMGGAVDVAGNVFDSPAEWNLYIDSAASSVVLSSGVPVTLVALDATNDVPVPGWFAAALERAEPSKEIGYLSLLVDLFDTPATGFYYMWDELAAAVVADAVDITTEEVNLNVVVGGSAGGQTIRADDGAPVDLVTAVVSPDDFYTDFISVLAGSTFEKEKATAEEKSYLLAVADSLTEFGQALSAAFGPGSPLDAEEYNGEAIANALIPIFDAMAVMSTIVETLDPPTSLASLHIAYLAEINSDLALRGQVLDGMRSAATFEEGFSSFDGFSDGAACEDMANEAFFLGVDVEFSCNP
jgi:pyrimidine-specific ribonucleoside hydrolase